MTASTDLLILCGGEASRLGNIDKPLRSLAGQPLIDRVLGRVSSGLSKDAKTLISANRNTERYSAYGRVLADDKFSGFGPLAGIAAGLNVSTAERVFCVPGDAPQLPLDLLVRLTEARAQSAAPIAFAADQHGPQPLCCLIDTHLRDDLARYLASGGRTPREWFAQHSATTVVFRGAPGWAWSVNTFEEWADAEVALAIQSMSEQ